MADRSCTRSGSTNWSIGSGAETSIVVLAGATGVGKTRAAIELCRRLNGEIVGADSVQVYRGFDIGSGKPSAAELAGVSHHLIDVAEPTEAIDAVRFAELADAAIAAVVQRGRLPVVAGGTGLWLRALLRGLVDLPKVAPGLRAELEREFREQGGAAMHERLALIDPRAAARVHPRDMIRIVRALEVHAQTGHAMGELQVAHALGRPRYRALTFVLDVPRPRWLAVIEERTRRMLGEGLIAEVRGLTERYGEHLKPLRSVGYRQVVEGLAAGLTSAEIELRIVRATRLYGKRQRTWFRTDPSVDDHIDASVLLEPAMLARIRNHLAARA